MPCDRIKPDWYGSTSKVNGLGLVEKKHLAAKLYVFTLAETLGVTNPAQGPFPQAEGPCLSTLCAETRRP